MKEKLEAYIREYVKDYPRIRATKTKWKEPLIAYADAKDSKFEILKKVVPCSLTNPMAKKIEIRNIT